MRSYPGGVCLATESRHCPATLWVPLCPAPVRSRRAHRWPLAPGHRRRELRSLDTLQCKAERSLRRTLAGQAHWTVSSPGSVVPVLARLHVSLNPLHPRSSRGQCHKDSSVLPPAIVGGRISLILLVLNAYTKIPAPAAPPDRRTAVRLLKPGSKRPNLYYCR